MCGGTSNIGTSEHPTSKGRGETVSVHVLFPSPLVVPCSSLYGSTFPGIRCWMFDVRAGRPRRRPPFPRRPTNPARRPPPADTLCRVEKSRSAPQDLSSPTVETTKEETGMVGSPCAARRTAHHSPTRFAGHTGWNPIAVRPVGPAAGRGRRFTHRHDVFLWQLASANYVLGNTLNDRI